MKLEALMKKKADLERQILAAQAAEKRKEEIVESKEFEKILHLPIDVLKREFTDIAARHP